MLAPADVSLVSHFRYRLRGSTVPNSVNLPLRLKLLEAS
jgi:hypothetical protein